MFKLKKNNSDRYEITYFWLILISLSVSAVVAIISYRFLYLDGAYFFDSILFKHNFNTFDKPRIFAQYITQIPAVFALKYLNIENKNTLRLLYDTTLYGIPVLSLLLSYYLIENKRLIYIIILSYFFSSIYAYSFIVSEAHVMVAIFWLALILSLKKKLTLVQKSFLTLLLILATHIYESYLILSIVLLLAIIYKISLISAIKGRIFWIVMLSIVVYGFWISLGSYLHPRDPVNAGQFSKSLILLLSSRNLQIFMILFIISFLIFKKSLSLIFPLVLTVITFVVVMYFPQFMEINMAYSGRTLLTLSPFIFGILYLITHVFWNKLEFFYSKISLRTTNATMMLAALFLGLQLATSLHWYHYIKIFKTALNNNKIETLKPFHRTIVFGKEDKYKIAREFSLRWTYPFMSYAITNQPILNVLISDNHHSLPDPYTNISTMKLGEIIYDNNFQKIYKYVITKILPGEVITPLSKKILFEHKNMDDIIMFHVDTTKTIQGQLIVQLNEKINMNEDFKITFNNHIFNKKEIQISPTSITCEFDPSMIRWNYTDVLKIKHSIKLKSFVIR